MSMIGARDRLYSILTGSDYAAAVAAINANTGEYSAVTIAVFAQSRKHEVSQSATHPILFVIPDDGEVMVVEHSGYEEVMHAFRVIVEDRAPTTQAAYDQAMAHVAAVRKVVLTNVRSTKYWQTRVPRWEFGGAQAENGAFVAQVQIRVEIRELESTTDATE